MRSSPGGTVGENIAVTLYDAADHVRGLSAAWGSIVLPDPTVVLAAGRAAFRVADLLTLAQLIQWLEERKEEPEC